MRGCDIENCSNKHLANGYCKKHYQRFIRHGDPHITRNRNTRGLSISEKLESFSAKDASGCIIWQGSTSAGYGAVRVNGKTRKTHRLSYEEYVGAIPAGMCVCHKCDTPLCINPDHLFIGTHDDNMKDMVAKGRSSKLSGSKHPLSKFYASVKESK